MMKRTIWLLLLLLVAACAQAPRSEGGGGGTAVPTGTPRAEEICLKPEDTSGITVELYKYAAHGIFHVKPGWTFTFRSTTIPGAILFPRAVDSGTVKMKVEPSSWTMERTNDATNDSQFTFRLLPDGKLTTQEAKPGWIVVTVQQALDKQGKPLVAKPWSLRIFAYDQKTAESHAYLKECQSTLAVQAKDP